MVKEPLRRGTLALVTQYASPTYLSEFFPRMPETSLGISIYTSSFTLSSRIRLPFLARAVTIADCPLTGNTCS